jgi:putative membrane protein
MTRSRFPRSVFSVGDEPDARFSLANERTFLAWNRTALALIAAGVALEVLGLDLQSGLRVTASILLIVSGIALPIVAWFEWMATERALRVGRELPGGVTGFLLASVVVVVGALVALGVLLP